MSKPATIDVLINDELAKARLQEIQIELKQIKTLRDKAFASGDVKGFNQLNSEMKKLTREANLMNKQVVDVKAVLKNLSGASIKELELALKKANAEFKAMKRNDAGFKEKERDVQQLQAELDKAMGRTKQHNSLLTNMAAGFNKYFTMATSFIILISGIAFSAKEWIKGLAGMDDALANVMKTTGMTRKEVRELYTEFRYLNTRTPRKELLELAEEAGRLGKKSKKDVMDFVEVANQIKVALGDDLGGNAAEAIKEVGKLTNIYKVGEKYGTDFRQSMLMVGSAINEVSANSQAQAPFLIDMLKRMGGLSDQADITAQDVIGYASALDQLGQSQEISGTALNKTLLNMFTDTATYAHVAKMEVNDFRKLLQTDANEALLQFLEGLNGNNEGLTMMAGKFDSLGLDSARAVQVLASLASNVQLVKDQQVLANKSLEEGTSLTNEYNIKNSNMAGNLEKIGRAIYAMFVNSGINKALEGFVGYFAKMVEVPVEKKLQDESREVAILVGRLTNSNTQEAERLKILEELKKIAPKIAEGLEAEKLSYERLAENVKVYNDEMVKRIVVAKLTKTEEDILAKAAEAGAKAMEEEISIYQTLMKFNSEIASSDASIDEKIEKTIEYLKTLGILVENVDRKSTMVGVGDISTSTEEEKMLGKLITAQIRRNRLLEDQNKLEKEVTPIKDRIKAFKEMLKLNQELIPTPSPGGDGDPVAETEAAAKLRMEAEKKAIESRIALMQEGYEKELASLKQGFKDKRQAIELDLKFNKELSIKDRANLQSALSNMGKQQKKEETELEKEWQVKKMMLNKELLELQLSATMKGSAEEFELRLQLIDQQKNIELAQVQGTEEEKAALKLAIAEKFEKQKAELINGMDITFLDKQLAQEITILVKGQEKKLAELNKKRKEGKISEEKYNLELQILQTDYSRRSLELAINKAEKELAIRKAFGEDVIEAEKALAEMRLQLEGMAHQPDNKASGKVSKKDFAEAAIDSARNVSDAIFQIGQNKRNAELDAQLTMLDKQREAELKNKKLTEAQKDAINEKYRKKEAALKLEAWKKDRNAAITQAVINGALAITKTFAMYGFTPAGWIAAGAQAVATGMQIAVIANEKPPIYKSGGYTKEDPSDDEEAGIVHSNEFVANAQAKRNPTVRPVLDIIDRAQRSGAINSINLPAVIAASTTQSYHGTGKTAAHRNLSRNEAESQDQHTEDGKLITAMNRFSESVDRLQRDGITGRWVYQDFKQMAEKEEKAIARTG